MAVMKLSSLFAIVTVSCYKQNREFNVINNCQRQFSPALRRKSRKTAVKNLNLRYVTGRNAHILRGPEPLQNKIISIRYFYRWTLC